MIQIMRSIALLIGFIFSVAMNAQDLKEHRWKNRILVVKTKSLSSKNYQQQLEEFTNSSEALAERKMIMYTIVRYTYYKKDFSKKMPDKPGKTTQKTLEKFTPNEDFEVILIGLDGGIKLRQTKVLTKKELLDKVDSMPMRSSEMRRKQKKN